MITLSLCMIVKNEEDVLARCLDCVKDIADEIIIVDTGSTDRTKQIANRYTDKVYDFEWVEDFSKARNFSFSKATMEYIMWLDADDVISDENQLLLLQLKNELSHEVDLVMMRYDVAFDAFGNPTYSYYRERIFKTAKRYWWVGEIHEVIIPSGQIEHVEIAIHHKKVHATPSGRNLNIYRRMIKEGKMLDPRHQYYYARELYHNFYLSEAIEQLEKFLEQGQGWIENNINACKDLAGCYYGIGDDRHALQSLFRSFVYDAPRAELCCDIGKHFFERQQYELAVYWYNAALGCKIDEKNGSFCLPDCYGYLPNIQLCVCYDRLGDRQAAICCNELAGQLKPNDPSYLHNKQYFEAHA